MRHDQSQMTEDAAVAVLADARDVVEWHCLTELRKWHRPESDTSHLWTPEDELVTIDGNLLMYGGASNLWQCLIGNGVGTAGNNLAYFNNANAAVGVGDSSTAAVATTNDLVAATNKLRKGMDATYPIHSDGVVVGSASILFRSSFTTAEANWVWNEWGIFNSATAATGRMLNRKVQSLGTKASGTWQLTLTLTLA